jgi:hypothetical protein
LSRRTGIGSATKRKLSGAFIATEYQGDTIVLTISELGKASAIAPFRLTSLCLPSNDQGMIGTRECIVEEVAHQFSGARMLVFRSRKVLTLLKSLCIL